MNHKRKQLPPGNWIGTARWVPSATMPNEIGNPLTNLNNRLILYTEAIKRTTPDKGPAYAISSLLASLCGEFDLAFIVYFSPISLGKFKIVKDIVENYKIKV